MDRTRAPTPRDSSRHDARDVKHDTDILLLLERGRRLTIRHGRHVWNAVYWGRDGGRELVASHDDGRWRMVRVDLHRMADDLEAGGLLSLTEIREIEKDLVDTMDVEDV